MGAAGRLLIPRMELGWLVVGSVIQYQKWGPGPGLGSSCVSSEGSASSHFDALVSPACSCPTILAVRRPCSLAVMCKNGQGPWPGAKELWYLNEESILSILSLLCCLFCVSQCSFHEGLPQKRGYINFL